MKISWTIYSVPSFLSAPRMMWSESCTTNRPPQRRKRRSKRDSLLTIPASHIHPQSRGRTIPQPKTVPRGKDPALTRFPPPISSSAMRTPAPSQVSLQESQTNLYLDTEKQSGPQYFSDPSDSYTLYPREISVMPSMPGPENPHYAKARISFPVQQRGGVLRITKSRFLL